MFVSLFIGSFYSLFYYFSNFAIVSIVFRKINSSRLAVDYSGALAHPGRSSAHPDRSSDHLARSALQSISAADQHTR